MQFNVKEWRKIYDRVQTLGQVLKDSNVWFDEDTQEWMPPKHEISVSARKSIEEQIKNLLSDNDDYLDSCGMKPNPPLWKYNIKDSTTWASHPSFKYKHLLNGKGSNRCTTGYQRLQRF